MNLIRQINHVEWLSETIDDTIKKGHCHKWLTLKFSRRVQELRDVGIDINMLHSCFIQEGLNWYEFDGVAKSDPIPLPE